MRLTTFLAGLSLSALVFSGSPVAITVGSAAAAELSPSSSVSHHRPIWDTTPLPEFYRLTPAEKSQPHGTLIRYDRHLHPYGIARPVTRVVFSSRNTFGHPIGGSAALLLPYTHTASAGVPQPHRTAPPLVVINDMINSLGVDCQPSFAVTTQRQDRRDQNRRVYKEAERFLRQGWAVLLPDFLGLHGEYGANIMSGRVVLDAIAAVTSTPGLGVWKSPTVITGYSGGAMATMFAAAQHPTYYPTLPLRGAAAGGTPVDLVWMISFFGALDPVPNPAMGYATGVFTGLGREYSDRGIDPYAHLTPRGQQLMRESSSMCHDEMINHSAGMTMKQYVKGGSIVADPAIARVGRENSLRYFPLVPTVPLFLYGAYTDIGVPFDQMEKVANRYHQQNPDLPVVVLPLPGPGHMDAYRQAKPVVMRWMASLFSSAL